MADNSLIINGREINFENEKNLLEVIRKANINLPTFCYHSELSVYGACRMCIVDIEGKGIVTSCSIKPEPGLLVKTHTEEVRKIRKIALELILANHDQNCTSCSKSSGCKLQSLSSDVGVGKIRFKKSEMKKELDFSSDALMRDPNKCILCGDCVRACDEIQSIGAIDFAFRGSDVSVLPAFGKGLAEVECVDCGQCARVCPTGSIIPKTQIQEVWSELEDKSKTVVAQIAPAVRVAIGEAFGMEAGTLQTGQIVAALKMLGFQKVYDTSFAADLTVIEETNEFLKRKEKGEKLPIFTSCCPAWVKFAEQNYPEFLPNVSTCKSPQQMFGSVAKKYLPEELNIQKRDLSVVSIMPCTAKKVEANKEEFSFDGIKEVDFVLTTQELAAMIKEAGINFNEIAPESLDMPFGFKTGAGLIFGNSGGVSEAVLRYAAEKVTEKKLYNVDFKQTRGEAGIREAEVVLNGEKIRIAVVHSLRNARVLIEKIRSGESDYDLVEVMSCPGGCIGGAGQPDSFEPSVKAKRTDALYAADKTIQLHKSQDNPYILKLYEEKLGKPGDAKAHALLHTNHKNRKRIIETELSLLNGSGEKKIDIKVCVGTNCFIKKSQSIMQKLISFVEQNNYQDYVDVSATFCMEKCESGPNVSINGKTVKYAQVEELYILIEEKLKEFRADILEFAE